MAFCDVHWFSATLRKQVATYVILPDEGSPPFPCFYLLHGLSDDHTIWHRRTRIEWYVRGLPLMVVMPDGFRSFYTNHDQGPAYGDYISLDLPAFVERNFPAIPGREGRCIGGLSMGGYGALRTALAHPDRYVSATSHSGAVLFGHKTYRRDTFDVREMQTIFGDQPRGSAHDVVALGRRAKASGQIPALRFDCGTEDFLIEDNRALHRKLTRAGVPHEYEEFPGQHSWDFWDLHVQQALRFHGRALGIKAGG
ncbi:MAG: esterase [Lentisphaerae bacterium RIFOXYB12_FULL_65_16]|nr:MAG: esterase [Lentisphaerae bacterium RIFOXYA12_64_32]OGV87113.1 MAG: esterase [Lentisphaerae bacterium RIFOXYB12_FULL_65_16]